jgi:hypothetical protein
MRTQPRINELAQVALSPLMMVGLVVVVALVLFALLVAGLCVVALFLPIILIIVGVVFLWRSKGKAPLLYIGIGVLIAGVLVYLWW